MKSDNEIQFSASAVINMILFNLILRRFATLHKKIHAMSTPVLDIILNKEKRW